MTTQDYENVISVLKADKEQSMQEYKNALSASLRMYKEDFLELSQMENSEDVQYALIDTINNIFHVLEKHGVK